METKRFRKCALMVTILLATSLVAEAQIGKSLIDRAKNATTTRTTMAADRAINEGLDKVFENDKAKQETNANAQQNASEPSAAAVTNGNIYYVSLEKGSARAEGTQQAPMKDIQKAIDKAADGDLIRIAQGNYLGNLDRGWIEIKGKYVSLEGGWNDDFSERNPVKYITRIQPNVAQRGTIGQGLLMIEALADRNAQIIIDGIFFDLGLVHEYAKADPTDERFGCPEGCETGRGGQPTQQDHPSYRWKNGRQTRYPQLHVPQRLVQCHYHDQHGRRLGNLQQRVCLQPLCILRNQRRSEPKHKCSSVNSRFPPQHRIVLLANHQGNGKHGLRLPLQKQR